MAHTRLRPSFLFFIVIIFVALTGFAQQPSAKPETGSSPAQKNPTVGGKPSPSVPSAPSASSAKRRDENAVISQPDHRINIHLGGISMGAGYSQYVGPAVLPLYAGYGPWGYGYWGAFEPMWWSPFSYGYGPYGGVGSGYAMGKVKFHVEPKTAEVLIDGAYAGTVSSLKNSVWLHAGAYNLCLKSSGHADFCRRIYVLSGKNLSVLARLAPMPVEVKP